MTDMTAEQAQSGGCCWPEQEAVWAWMKRHGIDLTFEQERDLKDSVSAYRITVQQELERVGQALTAPRVPDELRSVVADIRAHCNPPNPETCDEVSASYALYWADRIEALITAAPAPAETASESLTMGGRYNFIGQKDRLVYVGKTPLGWHQFEKVEAPGIIWAEIRDSELHLIERSAPAPTDSFAKNYDVTGDGVAVLKPEAARRMIGLDKPMPLFETAQGGELTKLRERVKVLEERESDLLSQILDIANVAGYGVPDAINNEGQPYQSHTLTVRIRNAARLRGGSDE